MPVMARRVACKPHGAGQCRQGNDEDRRQEQEAQPRAWIQDGPPAGAVSVSCADSQRGALPIMRVAGAAAGDFPPALSSVLDTEYNTKT